MGKPVGDTHHGIRTSSSIRGLPPRTRIRIQPLRHACTGLMTASSPARRCHCCFACRSLRWYKPRQLEPYFIATIPGFGLLDLQYD